MWKFVGGMLLAGCGSSGPGPSGDEQVVVGASGAVALSESGAAVGGASAAGAPMTPQGGAGAAGASGGAKGGESAQAGADQTNNAPTDGPSSGAGGNPNCIITSSSGALVGCAEFFRGNATCIDGVCTGCPNGFLDCRPADGCETPESASDCGRCGGACASGQTCVIATANLARCQ